MSKTQHLGKSEVLAVPEPQSFEKHGFGYAQGARFNQGLR